MADVLSQPQGDLLRRRRMSTARHAPSFDMTHFMDYDMGVRPTMDCHTSIPASSTTYIPTEPTIMAPGFDHMATNMNVNAFSQSNMAPATMAYSTHAMALDTGFTNPYNLATTFNPSLAAMPQMDQPVAWPQYESRHMAQIETPHARNNSFSSFESCPPLIKSEDEQSPIQPSQMFYNAPIYTGQVEGSPVSSDGSTSPTFSTDVDTLMKAIQVKTGQSDEPVAEKVRATLFVQF